MGTRSSTEARYAPIAWLLWAAAILLIAASTRHPLLLGLLLATVAGAAWRCGRPFPWRMTAMLVGAGALWNVAAVHIGTHPLFRLPTSWPLIGGPCTLEALCYGALNGLALATIVAAFALVFALLSPRELARLVPPALYEVGLTLSVALAFFPHGRESLRAIREAQTLRGYRGRGWRDWPPLLFPFLTLALEEALALADSLESRGFVSRRRPPDRTTTLLLAAALLLPLLGSAAFVMGLGRLAGRAAIAGGAGAALLALHRLGRHTVRTAPPRAEPRLVSAAALTAALLWTAQRLLPTGGTTYDPYRTLALAFPPPAALMAVLLLSAPIIHPPRLRRRAEPPRPAPAPADERPPSPPPVHFHRVSFAYPHGRWLFRDLACRIAPGSFTLVVGASGSGKSTFLRMIDGLVPQSSGGHLKGRICVGEMDTRLGPARLAPQVGLVIQRAERSFVADVVAEEVAFAAEQAALPSAEIEARVRAALDRLAIPHLYHRRIATLSGGEKQRVALAAALTLRPPILLLDEPLGQLDEAGREALVALLRRFHAEGMTVVVAEHRLERLRPLATQIIRLDGRPAEPPPLPPLVPPRDEHLLRVEGLTVGYGDGPDVLRGLDFAVRQGEIVALIAPNGSGKSTLFRALVGLLPPRAGTIHCCGRDFGGLPVEARVQVIGYLPQDPDLLLFAETVADEVRFTLRNHGLPDDPGAVMPLLEELGLAEVADRYPRDLSLGQRQRVALAAILAPRPRLLLLDEPTRGLDARQAAALGRWLRRSSAAGMGVILATHNRRWATALAHRTVGLEGGYG